MMPVSVWMTRSADGGVSQPHPLPMDNNANRQILGMLLDTFGAAQDPLACLRLRHAIYIHGIVDAVLNEQVARLPEVSPSLLPGRPQEG